MRGYKHKARWAYDERDVRAAGRTFAELDVDLDDVVDVELPAYRDVPERDPEEWHRPDWRRLMSWMVERARNKLLQEERPYEKWGAWTDIGPNGLPGGLTWQEFVSASSQARHLRNIAGTRPLQLLTWSGENWLLPRAYTELLDRWEQREEELIARARLCSCGAQGPYWGSGLPSSDSADGCSTSRAHPMLTVFCSSTGPTHSTVLRRSRWASPGSSRFPAATVNMTITCRSTASSGTDVHPPWRTSEASTRGSSTMPETISKSGLKD